MFFSTYVLGKKGPLAKIWLAAHWDKKLTRNDVKVIDLNQTVVQIVQPSVPIALRTSGELLIGVVRIYALKVRHLLKDATDATMMLRAANVQIVRTKEGGKDSAIAVTMDLVAGKAENMLDADFDDIADILKTGVAIGSRATDRVDSVDILGTAWFTAEPSQFLEEHVSTQGDDIARIRAEMRAFGRSESGSKSTSGSGSADKARVSTANVGDNVLQIGGLDDMDLMGHGNLDDLFPTVPVEDPFVGLTDEDFPPAPTSVPEAAKRKPKGISIDTTDTILTKADYESMTKDTSDIVNAEGRRGPVDATEAACLLYLRNIEQQRTVSADVFSSLANPSLRAVFAAAVASSANKAAIETTRGGDAGWPNDVNIAALNEEYGVQEDFGLPADVPLESAAISRKRGRDDDAFSASALGTLETYRTHFSSVSSVSFESATARLQRIDAARMFVDTLALASHGVVEVRQSRPFGEIIVRKTELSAKPLMVQA